MIPESDAGNHIDEIRVTDPLAGNFIVGSREGIMHVR